MRKFPCDRARLELHIRQQVQRAGGRDQVMPLKTKKSRRTLPLTADVQGDGIYWAFIAGGSFEAWRV